MKLVALLVIVGAAVAAYSINAGARGPSAAAAVTPDPILGTWDLGSGGEVVVTGGPTHFVGTVSKPTSLSSCVHPVGQVVWDIDAGTPAGHYTGTHVGFNTPSCTPLPGWPATWDVDVSGSTDTLHFCDSPPPGTQGAGVVQCYDLQRVAPPAPSCGWLMLATRGSDDRLAGVEGYGMPNAVFLGLLRKNLRLGTGSNKVVTEKNTYPATDVWTAIRTKLNEYVYSERQGVVWLVARVRHAEAACPTIKIVLAGYSQGADATADALQGLTSAQRTRVLAVALFGDPLYNSAGPEDFITNFQRQEQVHDLKDGLLTTLFPKRFPFRMIPPDMFLRVLSYCHVTDPICQAGEVRRSTHTNYALSQDPRDAAAYFATTLKKLLAP